jgi:hypothetical protein
MPWFQARHYDAIVFASPRNETHSLKEADRTARVRGWSAGSDTGDKLVAARQKAGIESSRKMAAEPEQD